jgi:hypothetical protein
MSRAVGVPGLTLEAYGNYTRGRVEQMHILAFSDVLCLT